MLAAASTCTLLCPVPLVTCLCMPSSASLAQEPEPSWWGWAGSWGRRKPRSGQPSGAARQREKRRGAIPCAFHMCLSAHEAAALGSAGWMVVAHTGSTLQGGMGPGLFQLQRKKTPDYFFFFFNSSEILSCCFAEVDALAAMASAKCCSAPGCAAPTSPCPYKSGKSQWIPTWACCRAAHPLVLDAGSWVLNVKCRRSMSPHPPGFPS